MIQDLTISPTMHWQRNVSRHQLAGRDVGRFKKINSNLDIPVDKIHYHIQCSVPGSKKSRLTRSFPPIKENYSKAVQQIKERFNQDLLEQIYVRHAWFSYAECQWKN
ncbi:hypothetical protein TNIN_261331 [Trichonephila inaurata madagascariensis]|uniref:Uncharacterized protein n=1 Tax=Trichonephila inaurata madagascariensis TaxID=2747483 RepID=A0A8X6XNY6_9ARAC|nr:hypothetical protein TNIN_261331 [Trichonephila inaurata madagascariensis]